MADACNAGDCAAPLGTELEVNRIRLLKKAAGITLAAKGRFTADPSINPSASGATIEFRALGGGLLYSATIGPDSIKRGAAKGRYRFAVSKVQSAFLGNGITRLDFRIKGSTWLTTLKAETPLLRDAFLEPTVTWMIRIGDTCVRRINMLCAQEPTASICSLKRTDPPSSYSPGSISTQPFVVLTQVDLLRKPSSPIWIWNAMSASVAFDKSP